MKKLLLIPLLIIGLFLFAGCETNIGGRTSSMWNQDGDTISNDKNASSTADLTVGGELFVDASSSIDILGVATTTADDILFQVSAPAGNNSTTIRLGDDGLSNTVGTCIDITNDEGEIYHLWIDTDTLTATASACT